MERHEIASVRAMSLFDCGHRRSLSFGKLAFELGDPSFEVEHALDACEVQALVGELLDTAEQGDVGIAVSSASTTGTCRIDQTLALVDSQRLGMHAGKFGSNTDHVDRSGESLVVNDISSRQTSR